MCKRNDNRTIYNVLYQDGKGGIVYMKRFAVTGVPRDTEDDVTQGKPGSNILWFTATPNGEAEVLRITLKPKYRLKILQFDEDLSKLAIKGKQARGNLVTKNEIHRISLKEKGVSTLGDREVWFDPDILRLNYEGHGTSLGKFCGNDRVLVIMKNGDYYTTSSEATNHYEEGILRIEKFDAAKVWTAIVNDADQGYIYLKRFTLEDSVKKQNVTGTNPDSQLILLTDEAYPRFNVQFGGGDSFRDPLEIDAEQFIAVKSFRAKGKRLSNYQIEKVEEIEPRIVEPSEPQLAADTDLQPDADTAQPINQQAVKDQLTGQMRMFDNIDDDTPANDDEPEK